MKVVKPIVIEAGVLVSTNAVDSRSEWSAGTSYALGDRVKLEATKKVYECIEAPSLNNPPTTSPLKWMAVSPTNQDAMFDDLVSTQTVRAGDLTVVLKPGFVNSLAMLGLEGSALHIDITDGPSGPNVYSRTLSLDGTLISDWYQYFFEPSVQLREVVLTDLPPYGNGYITASITGTGDVKCGHMSVGTFYDLGHTQFGARAGIMDFSRKDTSAAGITTLVKRNFSKRLSATLELDTAQITKVQSVLADLRATPCAWVGADDTSRYAPLAVWGFYRDFSIDVAFPTLSYCSLEIEGLV